MVHGRSSNASPAWTARLSIIRLSFIVDEVRVMNEPLPTVVENAEIGIDNLVVKNEAGIETRIPVTSIKAVIRLSTR